MSLFGEWLCLRREMQEIPLSEVGGSAVVAANVAAEGQYGGRSPIMAQLVHWLLSGTTGSARYRDSRLLRPFAALHTVLKRYVERARS
ncbi:hypothetical protein HYH03_004106 [Edaphochlamys debaryana]|uniref:Uncharacterized protein n=1 Tax=Edaphochlamys debaryana TaxID=47281 RepID=A0A835Y7R9_9CHLO|nr:hypothetical protein HYH03_004106 [Edaphochlamys debaryana]|eukprot:KAG2497837.1 hypothetical protein HYH03_004106 [Edaphochlamys debaryana]